MSRAICTIALAALLFAATPAWSEQPRAFDIPQIKAALRITPAQEPYWAAVEAVLRDIAQSHEAQQQAQANTGAMQRGRQRTVIVLDNAAVSRLAQAARPLVAVLTDDQKRSAQDLARRMGLGHILAAMR
jgi:hypothetical protein